MNEILHDIAQKAEKAACIRPEDYQDRDGFWVCGRCHTRKQSVIGPIPGVLPKAEKVFCLCKCAEEKRDNGIVEDREQERRDNLRTESLSDMDSEAARAMTLGRDDGSSPFMTELARKYTQNWQTMMKSGRGGLVLWGNPGTGKTFFATAIGNEVKKQGATVARVTAAQLVQAVQGMYDNEKQTKIQMLNYNDLIILDDLGSERDTDFAREVIFSLIDTRSKNKKPIIVTTNMTMKQMQEPTTKTGSVDMGYKRIFDRIMGMSTPVQMSGESHRRQEGNAARDMMRGLR